MALPPKGRKIGTQADTEGRVHMESNTWAVLSGVADPEQGKLAMDAVDKYLYTPYGLMLNAPCFTVPDDDIGFVTRVYPGLKENGSIFSHPNPWAWCAEAVLGRGSRAMKFYDALCPAMQNDRIEVRKSEPYSYCQFVSGRDHTTFGEAHHPFMTGSAGWGLLCGHPVPAGRSPGVRQPDGRPLHPGGLEGIYGGPHLAGGGVPHPCDEPQGRGKGRGGDPAERRDRGFHPCSGSGQRQ